MENTIINDKCNCKDDENSQALATATTVTTVTTTSSTSNLTIDKPKLSSFVEDNSGGFSSTRLVMLMWSIGVFLVWAVTTCWSVFHSGEKTMMSIPGEVITVLLGVMGLKVVQRFGEKDNTSTVNKI
jgi:hypothetical protein